jgi:penicillin amidase
VNLGDWAKVGAAAGAATMAVGGALGSVYAGLVRRPLPKRSGRVTVTGLGAPVEVVVDTWGVPHVEASSLPDLMRAQGYLHAQDRLWQMELNRRIVAGRLAEVLGEPALPLDRWMRTLSLRHVAEQELDLHSPTTRALLDAYAGGVNARIAEGRLPIEFTLLRHRPEPWTPMDSLAWVKMMALTLSVNWEAEIVRARIIDAIGPELAAELEPPYASGMPYVLADGIDYATVGQTAMERSEAAEAVTGPAATDGLGSNNWVVHGSRTDTGAPLLANDMHLGLTMPGIWYENHLKAPGFEVTGVSFPGLPGVVSGHTTKVAWGFTNGFPDVQDLYVEHLRERGDGVEYEFEGGWHPAEVRAERIVVRGGEPVVERVVTTRHGPVINSLAPEHAGEQPLALKWTAHEPSTMVDTLLAMNQVQSCDEMREALRGWHTPVQNVVYADVDGTIAHSYPGRIPVRAAGDGRTPVPGWTGEYEWTGYIPYDELPHQQNPPSGVIATANNRVVDDSYPYWLGADFVTGNRAARIVEMLDEAMSGEGAGVEGEGVEGEGGRAETGAPGSTRTGTVDTETFRRMHLDLTSISARRTAAALAGLASEDPAVDEALQLMADWDGTLAADSAQASIYALFSVTLAKRLLEPRMGDVAELYLGRGVTPVIAETSMLGERCREWLDTILEDPSSHWWDTGGGETREQQVLGAMADTVAELTRRFGAEPVRWRWGRLHTLTFRHLLGSRAPLDRLLNRGPYPMGGDGDTIWNSQTARHDPAHEDAVMIGPPFRFIADLSDLGQSRGQLVPGQSGQVGSPHYADGIGPWLRGDSHPMLLDKAAIEGNAEARVTLVP